MTEKIVFRPFNIAGKIAVVLTMAIVTFILALAIHQGLVPAIILGGICWALCIVGFVFSYHHGITIDDTSIKLICSTRMRKFQRDEVDRVEVEFCKGKKYFEATATVYLKNSQQSIVFEWKRFQGGRGTTFPYKITENDIEECLYKLSKFDFIQVQVKR